MRNFDEIRKSTLEGKAKIISIKDLPIAMTKEQLEKMISEGNDLNDMLNSPGWKKLNAWILGQINIENVLRCEPQELVVYQQYVKAYTDLFNYVNGSIRLRDNLLAEDKEGGKSNGER